MLGGIAPQERFPASDFVHVPQVLVFREHRTRTAKGRELKFGPSELLAVTNRCNERIRTSGDYAGVTIGHNPTREEKQQGAVSPPLIGFAGPFRCQPIPGSRPERWGIFVDLWIFHEDAHLLKRHPRRSAELWLENRYEDMYLDPIACLGGEAPRLDLGLTYSREAFAGGEVEIYAAAAMPGAESVFVPSEDVRKYEASNAMQLDPDSISQIVAAVMETPVMKWAQSKMAAEGGGGATPPEGAPAPAAEPPAVLGPGEAEKQEMAKAYQADQAMPEGKPDEVKNYSAGVTTGSVEEKPANSAPAAGEARGEAMPKPDSENYARINAENQRLRGELDDIRERLSVEQGIRVNAQRKARLAELANMGYAFDVDAHTERCQYSKMSDAQFEQHVDTIVELAPANPIGRRLYVPHDAPTAIPRMTKEGGREHYSKSEVDEAIRICTELQKSGHTPDYKTVLAKVGEGKGGELLAR